MDDKPCSSTLTYIDQRPSGITDNGATWEGTTKVSFATSKTAIMTAMVFGQALHFANQLQLRHHQHHDDQVIVRITIRK